MTTLSRLKQPWQLLEEFLSMKIQFYMSAKIPETLESCTYFGSLGSASATNGTDLNQPKQPRSERLINIAVILEVWVKQRRYSP
jgi:hypothetical protein